MFFMRLSKVICRGKFDSENGAPSVFDAIVPHVRRPFYLETKIIKIIMKKARTHLTAPYHTNDNSAIEIFGAVLLKRYRSRALSSYDSFL